MSNIDTTGRLEDAILDLEVSVQALRLMDPDHKSANSAIVSIFERHAEQLRNAHEAACEATL